MTDKAQQPEQEYYVYPCGYTCKDCSLVGTCGGSDKPPCSRPHTPTPSLFQIEPNSHEYTIGQIVEIDKRIKKERGEAARAATLTALDKMQDGESETSYVWRKAQALRQQQERE
jgi:hypothetical protein